jgi:thioredoxin-related protein
MLLIFIAFIAIVFVTQKKEPINWIEDYEAGVKLAKEKNKPLLLAFYKPNTPMSTDTFNNTYNNHKVKNFVESNFVPILINVDEQPKIARRYNINYYPTHYVKHPDSEELFGPRKGWDPPGLFIQQMQLLLDRMNKSVH